MAAPSRHDRFPSALEAFFLVIFLFAFEWLVSAALYDAQALTGLARSDADGVIAVLGNGLLFSLVMAYKQLSYPMLFNPGRQSVVAVVGALTLPVLMVVPGVMLLVSIINSIVVVFIPVSQAEAGMFERMASNTLPMLVATCLLAPVLEEMLFRGIILRSFLQQYSRWASIVGSAAIFGLAHLNVYQFVVGLVMGTALGWLYERSRSLWPCIILHAAYNSLASLLNAFDSDPRDMFGWQGVASMACATLGFLLLQRLLNTRHAGT